MKIINRSNPILISVMAAILVAALAFAGGCKGEDAAADKESAGREEAAEQTEETEPIEKEESAEEEKIQDGEQEEEESPEEVKIPEEIISEIEEADNCFDDGMYVEAIKEYREAQRAIEGSELPDDKKAELLESIDENYQEATNISETARIHHSSAMTLIYEKRFEEAKAELEAALAIYPKYQTAIDALDSLEALMGLK